MGVGLGLERKWMRLVCHMVLRKGSGLCCLLVVNRGTLAGGLTTGVADVAAGVTLPAGGSMVVMLLVVEAVIDPRRSRLLAEPR